MVYGIHWHELVMNPTLSNKLKHLPEYLIALRKSDFIIVETNIIARILTLNFHIDATKIIVIPSCVPFDYHNLPLKVNRPPSKNPVILSVGKICPRKNQLTLIKALPKVLNKFPNTKLLLVGPLKFEGGNSYLREIQKVLAEENLSSHVVITGKVSDMALYEFYKNSDIFVLPTLNETQGIAILEAMAFGLPVITSHIPVIKEIYSQNNCAILVNPLSSEEIANAIIQLLSNLGKDRRATCSLEGG